MFSDISPLVDGTLAKMDSLDTTDGDALVEMKQRLLFPMERQCTMKNKWHTVRLWTVSLKQ